MFRATVFIQALAPLDAAINAKILMIQCQQDYEDWQLNNETVLTGSTVLNVILNCSGILRSSFLQQLFMKSSAVPIRRNSPRNHCPTRCLERPLWPSESLQRVQILFHVMTLLGGEEEEVTQSESTLKWGVPGPRPTSFSRKLLDGKRCVRVRWQV
jgi:hypothetical protein